MIRSFIRLAEQVSWNHARAEFHVAATLSNLRNDFEADSAVLTEALELIGTGNVRGAVEKLSGTEKVFTNVPAGTFPSRAVRLAKGPLPSKREPPAADVLQEIRKAHSRPVIARLGEEWRK